MNVDRTLRTALDQRRSQHRYRHRRVVQSPQGPLLQAEGKTYLAFCSNDYLGLANHPNVLKSFQSAVNHFGLGSGASHLVNGHSAEHHALEDELAAFTGRERALLFSTGYMANMGVINALVGRGDAVFEDKLNHASLLDGGLLSGADFVRFRHSDMAHLNQRLASADAERKLVLTDGVFSMDGDLAKLPDCASQARAHKAWLMVDDAHGLGCLGKSGRGTLDHFGLGVDEVPILIGTLGKAFGTFGAFVAGSETLIEYLIQFARPYIYTTALPPAIAAATRVSLALLEQADDRRQQLRERIAQFRSGCEHLGLQLMPSQTPIQPILLGDDESALKVAQALWQRGIWITAIRPPTVPEGTARLRVTFSAEHSAEQVDRLLDALSDCQREALL